MEEKGEHDSQSYSWYEWLLAVLLGARARRGNVRMTRSRTARMSGCLLVLRRSGTEETGEHAMY